MLALCYALPIENTRVISQSWRRKARSLLLTCFLFLSVASQQSVLIPAVAVPSHYNSWISLQFFQHFQNQYSEHWLPSASFTQALVPAPLSSETQSPTKLCLLFRGLFQFCLAPPLSLCVLIISTSSFCFLSPKGCTCSYNYYLHDSSDFSFYFFSYVVDNPLYQIVSLQITCGSTTLHDLDWYISIWYLLFKVQFKYYLLCVSFPITLS